MRTHISLTVLFFLGLLTAHAQAKIYGRILNAEDKPLKHASVLLLNPKDSSLAKGTLTNEDGTYSLENIAAGDYIISGAYAGMNPAYSPKFSIKEMESHQVPNIKLLAIKELDEVVVTVKKPLYEQKIDRLVINVAAAITYTGISALDVLERSPEVNVNRVQNMLSINGKNGVIVMINGKRNYMDIASVIEMLAGIPSGNVEKIEIITTPPANFDAEGTAGIINIVLKSNEQYGTNGSYTLTAGYNKGDREAGSFNINHRKERLNVFGNYSFSRTKLQQLRTSYHATTNDSNLLENYSEDNRDAMEIQHNGQAGVDYHLNKNTIVGALLSANYRKWTMESLNDAFVTNNHQTDTVVDIVNNELHTTLYYGANLNFQHDFKADEKLTINGDYLYYKDKDPSTYLNNYYDGNKNFLFKENVESNKLTPLHFWILALDYSKKLSKKADMEAGLKGSTSGLEDGIQVASLTRNDWVTDTTLSGSHRLNESIGAAYSSFSMKFSDKTSAKVGLRYEYSETSIESLTHGGQINRYYGEWFPSVFFLHSFKETSSLNFSYSRRIYRPSYADFAPYVIFQDPKTFQTGNPALQPSFTDNVSMSYTYKNKIISVSYSYMNPTIVQQPRADKTSNRVVTASANANQQQTISANLSLPFNVTNWWNMQNNVYFGWMQFNGFYEAPDKTESTNLFFNGSQNFTLPKSYSISVSGYYSSGFSWGNYVFKSSGSIDAGMQKKFKNRSSLSLNITNIVHSFMRMSADVPSQNLMIRNKNTYAYTGINISFTHNFGSDKVLQKRDRTTGAEDEKGRAY